MQCTNENTGAPRPGCSAFNTLKKQFDDSYNGNRAPTQILIHTPYLQHKCEGLGLEQKAGRDAPGPCSAAVRRHAGTNRRPR